MNDLPLLILHGALGSKDQFKSLASLLNNEFEVHLLNFSGHGGNKIEKSFSIELFTNDVLQYLSNNNLQKVNLFGYSMGGYVALNLANKSPEKVNKIFTLGTKFNWTPESAAAEIKLLNPEKIEVKIPAFAQTLQQRHKPEDWKKNLTYTSDLMTNLGNDESLKPSDLNNLIQEVIIGIGALDTMVSIEESKSFAEAIPKGKLKIFDDFKHPIEQIDVNKIANELKTFFKR